MVVTASDKWDTIGGGNLEEVAIRQARSIIEHNTRAPVTRTVPLSEKARSQYGVQCCGGEVTVLFEPVSVVPSVAIFGAGHIGLELARILSRQDLDLHLVDSRSAQLSPASLAPLQDAVARVQPHIVPVLPELVLVELPPGTHVLIMTHDHAEDAALCDAALRTKELGFIGLIGSASKWTRFVTRLVAEGHSQEAITRITSPIGIGEIRGKEPASIAISIAAQLQLIFERKTTTDETNDTSRTEPEAAHLVSGLS